MKNILNQKPNDNLNARLKFSLKFVAEDDIRSKKILDIGCGFGWFELDALKRNVKEVHGIEITKKDLEAVRNIKDKRFNYKVGNALKIPYKDKYFDTIVAWEVIEHIPKGTESKMFKEIDRVLKKNGKFYLSTPYDSVVSRIFDPAWWLIGHRHYSLESLEGYGKSTGFIVDKYYIKGRVWNLINILDMYISKWIFRRKPFFGEKIEKLEEKEYKKNGFMGIFVKYTKR